MNRTLAAASLACLLGACSAPAPAASERGDPKEFYRHADGKWLPGTKLAALCREHFAAADEGLPAIRACLAVWPTGNGFDLVEQDIVAGPQAGPAPRALAIVLAPDGELLQTASASLWPSPEVRFGVVRSQLSPLRLSFVQLEQGKPGRRVDMVFDAETQTFATVDAGEETGDRLPVFDQEWTWLSREQSQLVEVIPQKVQ